MYAILGATGKVGRATIRALLGRGLPVRAVVRETARGGDLARAGCELKVADLRDARALTLALDGARAVQVICPMSMRADDALGDMRLIVENIAAALEATEPGAVVAISDYGAEVGGGTGVTLLFHELEARLSRLDGPTTFLRSAEQMQNWFRILEFAAESGVLPSMHHPLTKAFPTVSAGDVGLAAAEILANGSNVQGRVVHIEGARRYTALDVAATLTALVGRQVTARELPRSEWVPVLVRAGLGESYARLVAELYDAHNRGCIDAQRSAGEVRRGRTELHEVFTSLLARSRARRSA
jgi:NAD(P)H dehydrogenase (quinone)